MSAILKHITDSLNLFLQDDANSTIDKCTESENLSPNDSDQDKSNMNRRKLSEIKVPIKYDRKDTNTMTEKQKYYHE